MRFLSHVKKGWIIDVTWHNTDEHGEEIFAELPLQREGVLDLLGALVVMKDFRR